MREMELVTAAAAVDDRKGPRPGHSGDGPKHAVLHTECLNCGATLHGKYCAQCGQGVDDHHRSILHLVWEVLEDFTHLDGRLMKTLPPLFLKPGQLARDHFEGRRQRHVPPLRLFLISLLIFMAVLEFKTSGHKPPSASKTPPAVAAKDAGTPVAPTAIEGAKPTATTAEPSASPPPTYTAGHALGSVIRQTVRSQVGADQKAPAKPSSRVSIANGVVTMDTGSGARTPTPDDANLGFDQMAKSKNPAMRWGAEHGRRAMANRDYFRSIMFEWAHRLAILMLPIFAAFLTLCYFYKRKFYVYDHLIVAMHFLSFVFLIWALAYGLPSFLGAIMMLVATIWTPINLFMTLRGAYGSSVVGAGVKTFVLWVATLTIFLAMLLGVIFVAMGSI